MFPNTDGSSEPRATGTPWLTKIGSGWAGIEDVKRYVDILSEESRDTEK